MPLSILSVATTYPRYKEDTERAFVHDLNRHLVARGHAITVLAPHAPRAALRENLGGVEIRRFRYAPDSFESIFYGGGALPNLRASWSAWLALPSALLTLRKAIRGTVSELRPDLIHVHWLLPQGYFALAAAAKHNVPLVVTVHGADIYQMALGKLRILARRVITGADALTANTQYTARAIESLARPKRLEVLPMGLDLAVFRPARRDESLRQKLGIHGPWILGIGRLVEKKGFIYLIEALPAILKAHPRAVLTLGGEGPEKAALEAHARNLNVTQAVKFLGPLTREEVARYMASADLFAGPSIMDSAGDTEAQGLVFVEAMASGCPVVASTAGGIPDVITDGIHGILAPPKDSAALAASILSTLAGMDATRRRVEAGLLHARQFGWKRIAAGFEVLFAEVQPHGSQKPAALCVRTEGPKVLFISRKLPPSVGGMEQHSAAMLEHLSLPRALIGLRGHQIHLAWWLPYAFLRGMFSAPDSAVILAQDALLAPLGVCLGLLWKKPVVVVAHGLDVIWPHRWYQWFIRWALPRAARIICVSAATRAECLRRGVSAEAIRVIPNGIRPHAGLTTGGPRVLYVGRLVPRKGADWFVASVAQLLPRALHVDIVGQGPLLDNLRKLGTAHPNVSVHGYLPDEQLTAFYKKAGVFIMPNRHIEGDMEGFGITALEAQSWGIPVAASAVEGIVDAVEDQKTGILLAEPSPQAWADAIEALCGWNAEQRRGVKRRVEERFAWRQAAAAYEETLRSLVR